MGILVSNTVNSANIKCHMSLNSSGGPDWSIIPSSGKSSKSKGEFTDEIKELPDYLEEKPSFDMRA